METSKSKLLTCCLIFLMAFSFSRGQPVSTPETIGKALEPFLRVSVQNGNILLQDRLLLTSLDEDGNIFKTTKAISAEYGWHFLGGETWHQTCKYPRMGMGLQYLHVMNRDELGHPFSVYGFYDGIYFRSKNFELTNRLALGLAYGSRPYDPADPFPNDIICTKLNVFAEMGLGVAVRVNHSLFVEPAFRFTHFSNGNTREPQKGLNIPAYSISLRSYLGSPPPAPVKTSLDAVEHRHEVLAYVGAAPRQLDFIDNETFLHETYGLSFLMANLHLGYNYAVSRRIKLGGGVDLIYDGTNGMKEAAMTGMPVKSSVPFRDKAGLSVFLGGENAIGRLSVVVSLNYMVAQTRFPSSTRKLEQRLGFKYHVLPNVFLGANVRAYRFAAAKAVEFTIGMRRPI